jgi:hypothetical protein
MLRPALVLIASIACLNPCAAKPAAWQAQALDHAKKQTSVADALWTGGGDLLVSVAKMERGANAFAERLCLALSKTGKPSDFSFFVFIVDQKTFPAENPKLGSDVCW